MDGLSCNTYVTQKISRLVVFNTGRMLIAHNQPLLATPWT